jgi:NitT/TauT family transport system substrate-binding protein
MTVIIGINMPFYHSILKYIFSAIMLLLFLSACDFVSFGNGANEDNKNNPIAALSLAVAPDEVAWTPWYFAEEKGLFDSSKIPFELKLISDTYQATIDKFISKEVDAVAISNIDAVAQIVRRDIQADVILITNNHHGNDAILLHEGAEKTLRGKKLSLVQYSARHYLLDRYLGRHQIPYDSIKIINTAEVDIQNKMINKEVYGVVTQNPNLYRLIHSISAKIVFDSRDIPNEIYDVIIVHRDTLVDHPEFAEVLLKAWFTVMKKLQGNRKGLVLDALANLAQMSREDYDEQLANSPLNDTPMKAMKAIRNRRLLRKSMRILRYFIERHTLNGNKPFSSWVSYPGRTPALLHFNDKPLRRLISK